jgi:hypothetical protein
MPSDPMVRATPAASPPTLVERFLGTFKGWALRKANTLAMVVSASSSSWILAHWQTVEGLASKQGVSIDTIKQIHAEGASIAQFVAALSVTIISGITEVILSRIAAKVAEQPVIPKALPV